jgi:hypothetical protein
MNKFQPEAPSGSPLTTAEAGAGSNPTLTRTGKLSRLIDWLGSARRINTDINDEMATLKFDNLLLRYANKHLRGELTEAKPLIEAGRKRKAADKRGAEKRRKG